MWIKTDSDPESYANLAEAFYISVQPVGEEPYSVWNVLVSNPGGVFTIATYSTQEAAEAKALDTVRNLGLR